MLSGHPDQLVEFVAADAAPVPGEPERDLVAVRVADQATSVDLASSF
jgi:hypothetical protein